MRIQKLLVPLYPAQGEWEGDILDLVLSAILAFPDAAFLGFLALFNICKKEKRKKGMISNFATGFLSSLFCHCYQI